MLQGLPQSYVVYSENGSEIAVYSVLSSPMFENFKAPPLPTAPPSSLLWIRPCNTCQCNKHKRMFSGRGIYLKETKIGQISCKHEIGITVIIFVDDDDRNLTCTPWDQLLCKTANFKIDQHLEHISEGYFGHNSLRYISARYWCPFLLIYSGNCPSNTFGISSPSCMLYERLSSLEDRLVPPPPFN